MRMCWRIGKLLERGWTTWNVRVSTARWPRTCRYLCSPLQCNILVAHSDIFIHSPITFQEFAEKCKAQGYQIRFDHLHSVRKDIKKLSSKVRKTRADMATKQLNSVLAGLNFEEISSNGKVSAAHLKEACSTYSPMKQTPRPQTTTWIGGTGCSLPRYQYHIL